MREMYYVLENGKLRIPAQDIAEVSGLELQQVMRITALGRLHLEVQAPDRLAVLIDGVPVAELELQGYLQ